MLKLISAIVPGIIAIIAGMIAFLGRKAAVLVMIIPAFLFLTAALVVCIKQVIVYLLTLAIVPLWISSAIGLFLPVNFVIILSNILAMQSCKWAYDKAMDKVKMLGQAN
jgi:hypothetical protein